jgi:hypothetical protein
VTASGFDYQAPVPEASTWLMTLIGLAAVALQVTVRRRRHHDEVLQFEVN